jgi:hypothetical protein
VKFGNYYFRVSAEVELSAQDLQDLYILSKDHYDLACKRMSDRGGAIYKWSILLSSKETNPHSYAASPREHLDWHYANLDPSTTTSERLEFGHFDRIRKMTEMTGYADVDKKGKDRLARIMMQCGQSIAALNREFSRLNTPGSPFDIAYRD